MPEAQGTAGALFRARQLGSAIAAANTEIRRNPSDIGGRVLLAELLLFAGNLGRADTILDAAAATDPTAAVIGAEFRQLLRAETARRQCSREGRIPEFLGEPTAALREALAAQVALRAGDIDEATRHAAEAAAVRPKVSGVLHQNGDRTAFDDFRDVDDLCAGFFEVLTTTGSATPRIGPARRAGRCAVSASASSSPVTTRMGSWNLGSSVSTHD